MTSWLTGIGITVLVLLILGFLIYYGLFRFLLGTPRRSTKIPDFYKDSPHYKVSRAGMAVMKTLPSEDIYRTSPDGLKLHAYLFPTEDHPKKFLLGIHGYKSYARPEFGPYVEFYQSLGYSLLLPDDRAHRPSEGKYIGMGVLDRRDCVDWAKWIVETYGEDVDILIHGVSMGGATVLAASGEEDLPDQVRGITADCGYTSVREILDYQIREANHMPAWLIRPGVELMCRLFAGYNFHSFTPLEQVKKARVPILFVHGGQDKMVPVRMVDALYDACGSRKRKLVCQEAGHAETIAFMPEQYHQAIIEHFGLETK